MPTVKFEPDASGFVAPPPGVIVLQEWWGIVPHIEDVCRRFAREGYVALAPDLYHGKKTLDAAEAQHLMEGLDWGRAVTEIQGAVKHLRALGCPKVGVVGFCMGGALATLASVKAGVDAAAAFYGFPPDKGAVDAQAAPTLVFFGEQEEYFSVPDARAWAEAQRGRGVPAEVVVYPGAGHAFFNDTRPEAYHEASARDAWTRTLAHFQAHLRA
jgi:carboxymethylenebutenolidase